MALCHSIMSMDRLQNRPNRHRGQKSQGAPGPEPLFEVTDQPFNTECQPTKSNHMSVVLYFFLHITAAQHTDVKAAF